MAKVRILLIEDSPVSRHMVSRVLRTAGYDVTAVADGPEGIAQALDEIPDAIVLDMDLPTLTGWDVARALKDEAATAAVPILALTAHALNGDRERALAAGCDEYATKPVQVPDLLARIVTLLKTSSAKAA